MAILTSDLFDNSQKTGNVFTPIEWGRFAIREYGLFSLWMKGQTIFDPTMGTGALLDAFIVEGLSQGYLLEELPIYNLFGCEKNKKYYTEALSVFQSKYNYDLSKNLSLSDFLAFSDRKYDVILGNPPWKNFVDLPKAYKEEIKKYFYKYDLINNAKSLLLGGSRIDIAALIISKAIADNLTNYGRAVFFSPLSILLNDGANKEFRSYNINGINFKIEKIHDFNKINVFQNVSTRYGLFGLRRDEKTTFPIPYYIFEHELWKKHDAKPLLGNQSPLSVINHNDDFRSKIKIIEVPKECSPRQGINTCGANDVFFFSSFLSLDDSMCLMNDKYVLPLKYVYPLITRNNFNLTDNQIFRWVLLPYHSNGKALNQTELKNEPDLYNYFLIFKETLSNRKGAMINVAIRQGIWWALLGVGPYNFFENKVVWQAYGKQLFKPVIFEGRWQANQSLQAYIPCKSITQARRILKDLSEEWVEKYLLSLKMEGTMNWAQPGKIKKILTLHTSRQDLCS